MIPAACKWRMGHRRNTSIISTHMNVIIGPRGHTGIFRMRQRKQALLSLTTFTSNRRRAPYLDRFCGFIEPLGIIEKQEKPASSLSVVAAFRFRPHEAIAGVTERRGVTASLRSQIEYIESRGGKQALLIDESWVSQLNFIGVAHYHEAVHQPTRSHFGVSKCVLVTHHTGLPIWD